MTREEIASHPKIEICPQCREAFENIALHWEANRICSHPVYSSVQKEITTGLLLYRGYLLTSEGNSNASLVCFLEEKSIATELFEAYGSLASKVMYVTGEEFFGQIIRRSYALVLRRHPYLTAAAEIWGVGHPKSIPGPAQIDDVSPTTYALLYAIVGSRGFDNHDWPTFDCSQLDAKPYHLRELLERYDSFVSTDDHVRVVLKDADSFFEDIERSPIDVV